MSAVDEGSTSRVASLVLRLLIWAAPLRGRRVVGRLWSKAWDVACSRWDGPVHARLHGRPVIMNFGYLYPVFARQYSTYNAPLVDAVRARARQLGRPAVVVDVGAAIGDTVLLLKERCGADVRGIVCVDGDEEFLTYLRANVGADPDVEIEPALLSRGEPTAPSLVRTHRGTASAFGTVELPAVSLDQALDRSPLVSEGLDVLKVDVDGYDGAVLAGARRLLTRWQPTVVFEWHPVLYDRAQNDVAEPFDVLAASGYGHYRWFTRTGIADGAMRGVDPDELRRRSELARAVPANDLHWDVVVTVADG